jgi:hypothetical protein
MAFATKELQAEYAKKWRAQNKDKISKDNKKYREENRDILIQYNKDYYKDNKNKWVEKYTPKQDKVLKNQYQRKYSKERYLTYKAWLDDARSVPCADCGGEFPSVCMQFDHIPERGEKKFNLAAGYGRSEEDINLEAAKCEIVCGNCHAIRTHIIRK